jgi:hypothetical protein
VVLANIYLCLLTTVRKVSQIEAYLLHTGLYGCVEKFLLISVIGDKVQPAKIEFGILEGRLYAEIIRGLNDGS